LLDIDAATDDLLRQTGDVAVYSKQANHIKSSFMLILEGYYFKSVGAANILLLLCCTTCNTFCLTYAQYWLKLWTEASSARMWFYIGGYLVLSLIAWVATSGLLW
jgi:ATP-binding cassette subfamily C (CFTR/MRP) protein 1